MANITLVNLKGSSVCVKCFKRRLAVCNSRQILASKMARGRTLFVRTFQELSSWKACQSWRRNTSVLFPWALILVFKCQRNPPGEAQKPPHSQPNVGFIVSTVGVWSSVWRQSALNVYRLLQYYHNRLRLEPCSALKKSFGWMLWFTVAVWTKWDLEKGLLSEQQWHHSDSSSILNVVVYKM